MSCTCIRRPMREAIAGGRGGRGGRADVNAPQSSPRGRGSCGEKETDESLYVVVNGSLGARKRKSVFRCFALSCSSVRVSAVTRWKSRSKQSALRLSNVLVVCTEVKQIFILLCLKQQTSIFFDSNHLSASASWTFPLQLLRPQETVYHEAPQGKFCLPLTCAPCSF